MRVSCVAKASGAFLLAGRLLQRSRTLTVMALLALAPGAANATLFVVTQSTWGASTDVGSFAWAIHQANLNAGADVISVTDGLQISVDGANATSSPYNLATISESVTILGNNARLVGNPMFLIQPLD